LSSPEPFGDSLLPGNDSLLHVYCTVEADEFDPKTRHFLLLGSHKDSVENLDVSRAHFWKQYPATRGDAKNPGKFSRHRVNILVH